jgi:DNA repair exonuclease SbcCD nuclease subunit
VKALILGDLHLSDRPPSIRHETYVDEILDKVRWCVELAYQRKCEAIVSAGDVFHVKAPSRTTHRLVQATHEVLTAADIPVLIVPGNHDLRHDRLDSLSSQPLGALGRMDGIEILVGGHATLPVFGLPYLQNWADDLYGWMTQWQEFADKQWLGLEQFPLLVTHAPIFPSHEDPPYETIDAADWAELMGKGACYYGHIHDQHGTYVPIPDMPVVLCNNGAISRGSLHEATLKRKPMVTVYDSTRQFSEMFEAIEVPHLPAEEVFALAAKAEADGQQQRLTEFLTGLDAVVTESMEHVSAHIATLEADQQVKAKAIELVELAIGVHG